MDKRIEEFVELMLDNLMLVKVNDKRVTVGRQWIHKEDLEDFIVENYEFNSVEDFINDVKENLNNSLISSNSNQSSKEKKMVKRGEKIRWTKTPMIQEVVIRNDKGEVMDKFVQYEKEVSMDIDAYEGVCYNAMCEAGDLGQTIKEESAIISAHFEKISIAEKVMTSLNVKAGKAQEILSRKYSSYEGLFYEKEDEYDGDGSFKDTYPNVFRNMSGTSYIKTKEDGNKIRVKNVFTLDKLYRLGIDTAKYKTNEAKYRTIISNFWDAKRIRDKGYDKLNAFVSELVEKYDVVVEKDSSLGDKLSAIWAARMDSIPAEHTVDVVFVYDENGKGHKTCSCCGGKVYTEKGAYDHMHHFGVKKSEVESELRNKYTIKDPKTGIYYYFDGDEIKELKDIEMMSDEDFDNIAEEVMDEFDIIFEDKSVDEESTDDIDEDDTEFDIDFDEVDTVTVMGHEVLVDLNAEDTEGMHVETPSNSEEELSEYAEILKEHWDEYDNRFSDYRTFTGEEIASKTLFNKYLADANFSNAKEEMKELEEMYLRSIWFTLEDDIQAER